ncbi:unnamed protein product [Schistocephalus solidus]|uniref:Multidrug resistance protein 1 n=1 Tax=Schistocephalus solidus TaxID=70667 RepID=A0A3P7C582_SCHSO|nr:unnamed protein product [Schistocephalus solidus]
MIHIILQSLLRQDASWYDSQASGSLISLISTSVPQIQAGLGNRVGSFVRDFVLFVGCLIMSYIKGWKLALVASSMIPLIIISFAVLGLSLHYFNYQEIRAYSRAGGISGEILSSIRTVFAFGAQEYSCKRYTEQLFMAERTGIKKSMALGAGNGFVSFSIFSAAALVLWYGITLVRTERFSSGTVILVRLFYMICSNFGVSVPDHHSKTLLFFSDFNLTVEPGQKVAIVGLSGSGKSTAIHLLQRFYDPASGEVLLDDHNVQNLHLGWLRQQLGVVAQEADIFTGTVADNIRIGSIDASDEEIEAAAILANAHEFIMKFPQGYDTWLDEGGAKLSGGQRQRIAIARALVRKPKILLLDEATSALDTRSERAVQQALDTACAGRSVIMVAHRLTTVRNADKIVVMQEGEVVETGTHDELKQAKGRYWKMLQAQVNSSEEDKICIWSKYMLDTYGNLLSPQSSPCFLPPCSILPCLEIAWFDQHENQPGILTARLAADAPSLEKISGSQLGIMVEATCLVIVSLAIACNFSWQLTLVNLAFFPFLVLTSVLQVRVFTMISFSAQGVGRAASFLPDLKSANTGARKIMQILRRKSKLPVDEGEEPEKPFKGAIEFRNLHFAYPDRKHTQVLQGFDHSVTSGSSVALVGQSGCGKSTILQLVLRFYEESGIFMDGQNIKNLAPRWIRSNIGVVLQQSDLFDLTIRENIAFGDLSRDLSMDEIIAAARVAKIHEFIMSLPEGYDTMVGIRGSQLSGGQRQRLAIARALVRKPVLLLLDEATSALDAENERAVQDALNETISSSSMTCLVVAHRLSTVEACDCVVVVEGGQKVESGPPQTLLQAKGFFYSLHSAAH